MKAMEFCALAGALMALTGCPQERQTEQRSGGASVASATQIATAGANYAATAASDVTLTLTTVPIMADISQGDRYGVAMGGFWQSVGTAPVYLQANDSAGRFFVPVPVLAPRQPRYNIAVSMPTTTPAGVYNGTLSVRACADNLCQQPYAGTTHSIAYSVRVNAIGEWETLQRSSKHDGYVPVTIDSTRFRADWTYESPTYSLSGVVTDANNIYFAERDSSSIYAKRASDGVTLWRHVFTGTYGPTVNPPTVSDDVVYVSTTSEDDTWLHALQASDGLQTYQSHFWTQWSDVLNPTVRNGKVYVNAGAYTGVVYAFNAAGGADAWNASAGTSGTNTPAADDDFVYAYNGGTLNVFNAADGSLATSIGPNPNGVQNDYSATPMLGSADHVLTLNGTAYGSYVNRQLLDYSVANQAVRWMSNALYSAFPAVAKGVVYAASNETRTFDALDESTGHLLWSWKPSEQAPYRFIANVLVTDNLAFVSTQSRLYAIDLRRHRTAWSVPTPGTVSLSAGRMLFVSTPGSSAYPSVRARITAYGLH